MNFTILPYVHVDNVWSLPDAWVYDIFTAMLKNNLVKRVFVDGSVKTHADFMAKCRSKGVLFFVAVNQNDELCAVAWLNSWGYQHCFAHLCMFPVVWGKHSIKLAQKIIRYWFTFKKADGSVMLKTIMGNTPESNRLAVRFNEKIGFKTVGLIPNIVYNAWTGETEGAVLTYIERQ